MLNTKKLLYILPDVAYVAELLPTKKEHTFSIQAFRQINGEFLDDRTLNQENITKLISKLEPEEHQIILPDHLFTNTILEVEETSETKVKQKITDDILPGLGISDQTHLVNTHTLTQLKSVTKVQLSAIDQKLVVPLKTAFSGSKASMSGVASLSWTLKAVISLEPSISVVQLGGHLYLAQHYIGVDQTAFAATDEVDAIVETVKTLKGAEPSIQTVYLISSELVESKLKEAISDTVPLQQLSPNENQDEEMPAYVQFAVQTASKTLSISDFPVPDFDLSGVASATATDQETVTQEDLDEDSADTTNTAKTDSSSEPQDEEPEAENTPEPNLPTPTPIPTPTAPDTAETEVQTTNVDAEQTTSTESSSETTTETKDEEASDDDVELAKFAPPAATSAAITDEEPKESKVTDTLEKDIDQDPDTALEIEVDKPESTETKKATTEKAKPETDSSPLTTRPVIKNQSNVSTMIRMIAITVAVLVVTVAVGVGIGMGILSLSNRDQVAEASPSPTAEEVTPSPSPSPSPEPEIDRAEYSILVVNATSIAGKAGDIADDLESGGFEDVRASNAKGEYESGSYVLMSEEVPGLIEVLEEDTGLTLTLSSDQDTEDPNGTYDAVLVFAEE